MITLTVTPEEAALIATLIERTGFQGLTSARALVVLADKIEAAKKVAAAPPGADPPSVNGAGKAVTPEG